jgi:AAA+ ATPase superfamily predicted ATPase
MNLDTIQQDIASLPPDAQQIIVELVEVLKKRYLLNQYQSSENSLPDWSDFIGCIEAETDLSKNYKNYLDRELRDLAKWLQEYLDEMWDQQIEADLASGKLDRLIAQAEKDIAANNVRDLDEILCDD